MEDFSGLALPPLFGGHILEAELPDEVELGSGEVELGPGGELLDSGEPGPDEEERRELDKRKYLVLSQRCKEIEQVSDNNFLLLKTRLIVFDSHQLKRHKALQ